MTRIPVLLVGLLLFFVSLPLALRKVPMNRYYGVRTSVAFKSDQNWYEINAYGGTQLAIWSVLIIAVGIAGFFMPREWLKKYDAWAVLSVVVAVAASVVKTVLWSRRYG